MQQVDIRPTQLLTGSDLNINNTTTTIQMSPDFNFDTTFPDEE